MDVFSLLLMSLSVCRPRSDNRCGGWGWSSHSYWTDCVLCEEVSL